MPIGGFSMSSQNSGLASWRPASSAAETVPSARVLVLLAASASRPLLVLLALAGLAGIFSAEPCRDRGSLRAASP
jgi:hypothetical protein